MCTWTLSYSLVVVNIVAGFGTYLHIFADRQRSCGKSMFSQVCVILITGRGRVSLVPGPLEEVCVHSWGGVGYIKG